MLYLVVKAALSGIIVAAVSEIARRYPGWGGLVASLPLTSLLAMIWLWRDTQDAARVAELSSSTFWFILPSLPLFLVLPALLRSGSASGWHGDRASPERSRFTRCWFWAAPQAGHQAVKQAVVLLSGGLDSMVCAGIARERGFRSWR